MKILQLISSGGFFGAENVVLLLSKEMYASLNENVENVIGVFRNLHNPQTEIVEHAKESNLQTITFNCNGRIDFKTLIEMNGCVRDNQIDIIHTHGYKSNMYGYFVAKMMKKPILSTCHNWIAEDFLTKNYYRLDKFILPRFDKVIAVSWEIEEELLRIKVQKNRVATICNGIDISKYHCGKGNLRKSFGINEKDTVIGTVARFTPEKGLINLLYVAKELLNLNKNVIFMIVGDGPLREELEKKSIELKIDERVIFTGLRGDMPEIYSTFDIFVLPSLKEGFPMVILEAMASKKPIISTKVGAISKIIENKKEGILIEPDNVCQLRDAIVLLLSNADIRKKCARNAYKKVQREYSSKFMFERYMDIYKEILGDFYKRVT